MLTFHDVGFSYFSLKNVSDLHCNDVLLCNDKYMSTQERLGALFRAFIYRTRFRQT